MNDLQLVGAALAGLALLLFLIVRAKLHAFVALLIGSLVIGIGAGMPFAAVLESVTNGIGSTLASIAALVGLGAMFGRMLEISGGAERLADALIARRDTDGSQWSLLAVGLLVAIPVFFDVAFIVLVSVVYGLTRRSGRPIVYYALPLLAGLAVGHAFIPPTPGPIAVAAVLDADLGWVVLLGLLIGVPSAIVAGPIYARLIASKVPAPVPEYMQVEHARPTKALPGTGIVVGLIAAPLILIVGNTVSGVLLPEDSELRALLAGVGHPLVALLITTLLSFRLLGTRAGYTRAEIQEIAARAIEPAGMVILVTAAGGVLKQVLVDSGVGGVLAEGLLSTGMPPLVTAFAIAAAVRVMQGSATVAMLTAAGLVAALFEGAEHSAPYLALAVIAIAAGATTTSHVNDSGFWLVNRYLGLSMQDTLRTWTVTTTLIAFLSILLVLLAAALFGY